jgi:hypothetical protein
MDAWWPVCASSERRLVASFGFLLRHSRRFDTKIGSLSNSMEQRFQVCHYKSLIHLNVKAPLLFGINSTSASDGAGPED